MKRLLVSTFSTTALGVLLMSGAASAHFNLMSPPAADNATDGGKGAPPCGPTSPSNVVTPVQGGQSLPIQLLETVMHPGHYRFALAATAGQIPADPDVVVDNGQSVSATIETTGTPGVLMDDAFDHTNGAAPINWQMNLQIPNVNCDSCTLQVIEFMAEHGANPGGGYFYHHCATLKISADMTQPLDDTIPGVSGSSSGGAMAGTAGSASMPPTMTASGGAGGASGTASAAGGTSGMAAATSPSGNGQTASASGGTMTGAPSSNATGTGVASAATPTGAPAGMAAMTGTTSATSNTLAPVTQPQSSDDGGGCALSPAASRSSAVGALALLALSLGWVGRRRR